MKGYSPGSGADQELCSSVSFHQIFLKKGKEKKKKVVGGACEIDGLSYFLKCHWKKKMVLMDTCTITSNWITTGGSVATESWPKLYLHFPEISTEL